MTADRPEFVDSVNHDVDGDEVKLNLYNANHGKVPRTGGPYRDDIEMEQAELMRAKAENRDPDFDNPPPSAGTVLVPASQLVERDVDKSHFTDTVKIVNEPVESVVVEIPETEPDPTQVDWDNNMDKVNALRGGVEYQELLERSNKPDPEPSDEPKETDFSSDV